MLSTSRPFQELMCALGEKVNFINRIEEGKRCSDASYTESHVFSVMATCMI